MSKTINTIKFTSEKSAVASKSFLKKAMIYGTDEYKLYKEFKAENPNVTVTAKSIKKNPNKESYKNLTYENMESYINELENKDVLLDKFARQKRMAVIAKNPYRNVLNWFKNNCFDNEHEFVEFRKAIADMDSKSDEAVALA